MANLKYQATTCKNPSTKANGFRSTVKANGKTTLEELFQLACKGTTLDSDEATLAVKKLSRGIIDTLQKGNIVEIDGVGNIGFSIESKWTSTAAEQKTVEKRLGIAFVPKPELRSTVRAINLTYAGEDTTSTSQGSTPTPTPGGQTEFEE